MARALSGSNRGARGSDRFYKRRITLAEVPCKFIIIQWCQQGYWMAVTQHHDVLFLRLA